MPRIPFSVTMDSEVYLELTAFAKRIGMTGRGEMSRLVEQAVKNLLSASNHVPQSREEVLGGDGLNPDPAFEMARAHVENTAKTALDFTRRIQEERARLAAQESAETGLRMIRGSKDEEEPTA